MTYSRWKKIHKITKKNSFKPARLKKFGLTKQEWEDFKRESYKYLPNLTHEKMATRVFSNIVLIILMFVLGILFIAIGVLAIFDSMLH